MIERKKKTCRTCQKETYLFSKGRCQACARKEDFKPIKKRSDKKLEEIKESNAYYQEAINRRGPDCYCENCGTRILKPKGRNVSHILGKGAQPSLYYHPKNNFLLCLRCEDQWTNGDKTKMKVYPESRKIIAELLAGLYIHQPELS